MNNAQTRSSTSMASPVPKWTQEQGIAYECACECITELMAIRNAELADEERATAPDPKRIATLSSEIAALWREEEDLHLADAAAIARVRRDYGARIREHRARHKAKPDSL